MTNINDRSRIPQATTQSYGDNLLYIKQEMHNIAVLRHIFLAFDIHLSGLTHGGLAAKRHIVVIFYHLGTDESLLEIGMDHA